MSDYATDRDHGEGLFGHDHVTVIEPQRGWRMLDFAELWAYRELLWVLALRDIKVHYKQTVLGVGWAILRPFITMVIFSVVFGRLAGMPSEGYPYPVFVFSALLPWTFFANALSTSGNSMVGSAQLVSKVYFPRLLIPMASIGAGLVDLSISTVVLLILMLVFGVDWGMQLVFAPLLLLAVIFTALGIGTLMSALMVAYRDFRHLLPFLIQTWLYLTPVIYPVSLVPEQWRWLLFINPMAGLIEGFRAVFLGKPIDVAAVSLSFMVAVAIFLAGILYFERVERRFADII